MQSDRWAASSPSPRYREFLKRRKKDQRIDHYEPHILETTGGSVPAEVHRSMDGQLAMEALAQVDETYQHPLALFYLQDLSYKEIAEVLDVPIGTVMSRLSRGKAQLRDRFQQKDADQSDERSVQS